MAPAAYSALEDNLLMFSTGRVRDAGGVLSDQTRNTANPREWWSNRVRMAELARQLRDGLVKGDIDDMGLILDENWQLKKGLSSRVSSSHIDDFYELAKKNGPLSGKLLGAGGWVLSRVLPKRGTGKTKGPCPALRIGKNGQR